jgi:peptidoglycan/xylan/chitin deacetylase (PgdA/CDA1 family)
MTSEGDRHFLFTVDVDWIEGSDVGVRLLCDFCDHFELRATFFVAGQFARRYPRTVADIARRGHMLGTHGWDHGSLSAAEDENFALAPSALQHRWLTDAARTVEDATGVSPKAFRAPNLLIGEVTMRILEDVGYRFDSSVSARRLSISRMGVTRTRYYAAPLEPYHPSLDDLSRRGGSRVLEVPPSAFLIPLNMSALRVLGLTPLCWAARQLRSRSPIVVFYAHPAEFVAANDQRIPTDNPARYRRGLGPQHLDALKRFVEYLRGRGYVSATLSDLDRDATARRGHS